jgi:hypothetical protein
MDALLAILNGLSSWSPEQINALTPETITALLAGVAAGGAGFGLAVKNIPQKSNPKPAYAESKAILFKMKSLNTRDGHDKVRIVAEGNTKPVKTTFSTNGWYWWQWHSVWTIEPHKIPAIQTTKEALEKLGYSVDLPTGFCLVKSTEPKTPRQPPVAHNANSPSVPKVANFNDTHLRSSSATHPRHLAANPKSPAYHGSNYNVCGFCQSVLPPQSRCDCRAK